MFITHCRNIEAILQKIRPEQSIFLLDGILQEISVSSALAGTLATTEFGWSKQLRPTTPRTHLINSGQEPNNTGTQEAKTAGHEERSLPGPDGTWWTAGVFDVRENISTNKRSDLAEGCRDSVVFPTNTSATGLRCDQTDVVARAHFTKRQEDPVDNHKPTNIPRLLKDRVTAAHDETNGALRCYKNTEGESRAHPVGCEGAKLEHVNEWCGRVMQTRLTNAPGR